MSKEERVTPGDIRKCVSALSTSESDFSRLLTYNYDETKGSTLGNLIINALTNITGSFPKAIDKLSDIFQVQGDIYPVTTDDLILCAGLENCEVVVGKENISERVRETRTAIKQIFLKDELFSPNVVKVVCEKNGEAIYFSRFAVPYMRGIEEKEWLQKQKYYKHIGVYAYRCDVLKKLVELKQTELEIAESLEQLRWIENGFKIRVEETTIENIAIDTPEDLLKLKNK